MIADAKSEAQTQGAKMIEQAKATIESEKNNAVAEIKNQVSTLSLEIAEKLLKEELSNKESQTKLVEKMLADVKLN
jgi:F-type H+-transporting ATPase subunit b